MPDSILFLAKTVGLGLLIGFVIGYLFKKISKLIVVILAIVIITFLLLGHNEVFSFDWLAITNQSEALFNPYFEEYSDTARKWLRNTPFAIGLVIGGLWGLSKG